MQLAFIPPLKWRGFPLEFLKIGDIVLCNARRVSSSHDSWGQNRNKNHGLVEIRARVEYDPDTDGKKLVAFEEDIAAAKEPKGKEYHGQCVWFYGDFNSIIKVLSNETEEFVG